MSTVQRDRKYQGASADQRRDQRRLQLLDAAVDVFGTTGYRNATVEKLCAAAGLTKRYFYESFDNSEDLLVAVYKRATETMRINIERGAQENPTDAQTRLKGGIEAYFHTVTEDPKSARIILIEILGVSERVDTLYRQNTLMFAATLSSDTFGVDGRGWLERRTAAVGLVGAVVMIAQQWLLDSDPQPLEPAAAWLAALRVPTRPV